MRKLIMKMSVSLDGFVSGPNGENDWVFKTGDEQSKAHSLALNQMPGLIIMGRKIYEQWAKFWPTAPGPFAEPMNIIPKAVFTQKEFTKPQPAAGQTAAEASWAEARIISGNLTEEVEKLKAEEGKPILTMGGAGFMRSLIAAGLIDEYHLFIHPVVLGGGQRIFTDVTAPFYLKLADVQHFPGGATALTYLKA